MDVGPAFAFQKGFNPLRLSTGLLIYFLIHPPPIFKGFQWICFPKAHILRTNGRVPLSGLINMLLLRSQHIVLACLKQNSLRLHVHIVTANLLTENEDRWKKIRSEWCVGSEVTFLSVLPNLQEQSCQAARDSISLGHGQLRRKLNYFYVSCVLNLELFPSPTLHMLWLQKWTSIQESSSEILGLAS